MTDQYSNSSPNPIKPENHSTELFEREDDWAPWQNLLIGFAAGALLSFVGLSISMDMTHIALADVSLIQWVVAIALPFLLGTLSIMLKQPFLNALDAVMRSLPY